MARTSPSITESEVQAWSRFCQKNQIYPNNQENCDFIVGYFCDQWREMLTDETMAQAYPMIRNHLKHLDPDTAELQKQLQRISPTEQEALMSWTPPRGIKASKFNACILVRYCKDHNWAVDHAHLDLSCSQSNVVGVLEKDNTNQAHIDQRRHTDDGSQRFTGDFLGEDVNKPLWMKRREQREASEAKTTTTTPQREPDCAWTTLCKDLARNGSHGQQKAQQDLFDKMTNEGYEPRAIYREMVKVRQSYENLVLRAPF